jgi:hypothetical protein
MKSKGPDISLPQEECRDPSILRVQHPTRPFGGQPHQRAEEFNHRARDRLRPTADTVLTR